MPATISKCQFCGGHSTLLCDWRIWDSPRGSYRVPMNFINAKTRSCDANVCRSCAKKITDVHVRTSGGCRWDTLDLCPDCQKVADKPIPIDGEMRGAMDTGERPDNPEVQESVVGSPKMRICGMNATPCLARPD